MKLRVILSAVVIVCAPLAHAQDTPSATPAPIKLDLTLAPGQVRAFKITVDQKGSMSLPGSGQTMPLNTGLTAYAKLIVDKQNADGTWAARYRIGGMKMLMNGMPMNMPSTASNMMIKGTISKNGGFTPSEDVSKLGGGTAMGMSPGQTMNNVLGNLMNLPDKPVSVGDTWTTSVPLPYDPTGKSILTVDSKVVGVDNLDGDRIVRIKRDVSGPLNMTMTTPAVMNIAGSIKGTGMSRVSVKTGSPLDDVSKQHVQMNVTGTNPSGNGEKMNITIDMDVTSRIEATVLAKTTVKPAPKVKATAKPSAKQK